MNRNFFINHELSALRRYMVTHRAHQEFHPIDLKWIEAEIKQLHEFLAHDPIFPSYSEHLCIEEKHRSWMGDQF